MDTTIPYKQPIRGSQPDPRTPSHRQAQSVIPQLAVPYSAVSQSAFPQIQSTASQSVTPQSEPPQTVSPQSEPPQTVSSQSASPQTQSHSVNPQSQSVSFQSVQKLSEGVKRAIDPTASMTDVVGRSGRILIARKNLRRLLIGQDTKGMLLDDEVINCYFGHLMA